MAPLAEALTIALQHHQAGRLQEAEALYRQTLWRPISRIPARLSVRGDERKRWWVAFN